MFCFCTEMKALTLQRTNVVLGEHEQDTSVRSLSSNYAPPSLENKFLVSTSSLMPPPSSSLFTVQPSSCAALQPSSMSSTSSSLLIPSSLSSPLLSTQNKLLNLDSTNLSLAFTTSTSATTNPLLATSLASGALLNRFSNSPSFLHPGPDGGERRDDGADEGREEISDGEQCCLEDTSVVRKIVFDHLVFFCTNWNWNKL